MHYSMAAKGLSAGIRMVRTTYMAGTMNIEVLRLRKNKRTAALLVVCALVIACLCAAMPGTLASYAQADSCRHVFVFSDDGDVAISVTETWNPSDGLGIAPGSTLIKQPVVKNQKGDVYMRGIVRIVDDKTGEVLNPLKDAERIKLIMGTLYADPQDSLVAHTPYSKATLAKTEGVSSIYEMELFDEPEWNEEMQAFTLKYKGVLASGASVALFDKVVVPSDYTTDEVTTMGDYTVTVWAQAIQAAGFDSRDAALSALSNQNPNAESKAEVQNA